MSDDNGLEDETHFLLRAMQTRLCASGVHDSDEGRLIRLAIAFVRRCIVTVPGANVSEEGKLTDLYPLHPGIWEVQLMLANGRSSKIQGSLAELVDAIRYRFE
ncbi:hypothetical protein N7540_011091 [Penicillium herquei]|nr:hypothetical protein N7540_011091 [Penicillium herquei]